MNPEQARRTMVERQIRPWEVLDPRVLTILLKVPRERFVPPERAAFAFADIELPIGEGETMLRPAHDAKALQALAIQPGERALEIGTGSGYFAACLAALGAQVTTIEHRPRLAEAAAQRLQREGFDRVHLIVGDAFDPTLSPWTDGERYDVIVLSGGLPYLPDWLPAHLAPGGRLFAYLGRPPLLHATLFTLHPDGGLQQETLFETLVPLLHFSYSLPRAA
ncbi:MAG: protein-L-isoaspartate O-methyltransferase [Hydrogenophilus sp.]|nr:protein-L-isoaspartate O-methyltransferase [Hydrogenophilus sp.]